MLWSMCSLQDQTSDSQNTVWSNQLIVLILKSVIDNTNKHEGPDWNWWFQADLVIYVFIIISQRVNELWAVCGLSELKTKCFVSMWVNASVNVQVCWAALVRTCLPWLYGWLHSCLCSCDLYNSACVYMSICRSRDHHLMRHYESRRVLESVLLWPTLHNRLHHWGWGWWQYGFPTGDLEVPDVT